jgi:UDP:flavonoid glycosyltransferase YjiC (YdhE family)
LQLPITLEQALFAQAVCRTGAALDASVRDERHIRRRLEMLLASSTYAQAARQFAQKYATFNPSARRSEMLERLEALLSQNANR